MDRRYVESDIGLRDDLAWLHELLCHADGSAVASNAASSLRTHYAEKRRTSRLDWKDTFSGEGFGYPAFVAKPEKDIRQLYVGSFSGWRSNRIY